MVTTDSETVLTTAGYLNSTISECATPLSNNDIIFALNAYNTTTKTGTFGIYTVVINTATGAIKLNAYSVPGGNVRLPVVVNDFAVFTNVDGQIGDAGYLPSNAALTNVTMSNITTPNAPVAGYFANFSDVTGSIANYSYRPSNAAATYVAMVNTPVTAGQIAVFADANGTLTGNSLPDVDLMYTNVNNAMTSTGAITLFKVDATVTSGGGGGGTVVCNGTAGTLTTAVLTGNVFSINWNNSYMEATSTVMMSFGPGTDTNGFYSTIITAGTGNALVTIRTTGTYNGTLILNYLVM